MKDMENNYSFLVGERIYLRPSEKEDLSYFKKWYNDPEIRGITGMVTPMTHCDIEKSFEKEQNSNDTSWFVVVTKKDNKVIGEVGLLRMFPAWRTTDLTIILGDKDYWGKGYGKEAIVLLMDYAFGYLNFHRISIGVVGFNERALEFYRKIGFKQEGIQRDGYYYNHKYYDFIMMSILESEFRELHINGNIK